MAEKMTQEQPVKSDEDMTPREHFERELGVIGFHELQKHFAKGILIKVDARLDLIEAAVQIHADNADQIKLWMEQEQLVRAHDEHAEKWLANRTELQAVTVAPWVLVQEND